MGMKVKRNKQRNSILILKEVEASETLVKAQLRACNRFRSTLEGIHYVQLMNSMYFDRLSENGFG